MSRFEQQFDELPEDLQQMVYSKIIHTPKLSVELLNDIKDFSKMKKIMIESYEEYNNEVDRYGWLVNDITSYYNNDVAYLDGVSDSNVEKVSRLFIVKQNKILQKKHLCEVFHDIYGANNEINHLKKLFNRSLGCLTPKEREEFFNSI